jgi:hypothetical protein
MKYRPIALMMMLHLGNESCGNDAQYHSRDLACVYWRRFAFDIGDPRCKTTPGSVERDATKRYRSPVSIERRRHDISFLCFFTIERVS